jgi:tetratricopeptide (TPR) repeat protein
MARNAFRQALELAETGIKERQQHNQSIVSFEFNMARCVGLGIGWIAYNEASLSEAAAALVMARHLLRPAKAKLISAYLDVVQATIMMSESTEPTNILKAIEILGAGYSKFAPSGKPRHTHYALRCQNELALAYLRLALACKDDSQQFQENLRHAENYVAKVKETARPILKAELRSYCTALITEARIKRARDKPDEALALAEEAKREGAGIELIRVDALIAVGEAELARQVYNKSISAFLEALERGRENRKDAAVCHLHLCRAYLLDNQLAKAKEYFARWESMKGGIGNAFITDMALTVEKMLAHSFKNFELTKEDIERDGDHSKYLDSLRRWLAHTALALNNGDIKAAGRWLKVHSATVAEWLDL